MPTNEETNEERFEAGEIRMGKIEDELADLKRELKVNTALTQDIRDVLETGRALFRLGGWLARIGAWLAPIVAALAALWAVKTGRKP